MIHYTAIIKKGWKMKVVVIYFSGRLKVFENITKATIKDSEDYALIDSDGNKILVPKIKVEYITLEEE